MILFLGVLINSRLFSQKVDSLSGNVSGLLVMSEYNYLFDYSIEFEHYPIGNHDYFYPNQSGKLRDLQNIGNDTLNGGLRIAFLPGRYGYKQEAVKLTCIDTSNCYQYKSIFVLPVTISYSLSRNMFGTACNQNFLNIMVNEKRSLFFRLSESDIRVIDGQSINKVKKSETKAIKVKSVNQ